jgi:uncharacterized protein YjbJ (UPF0337 family)
VKQGADRAANKAGNAVGDVAALPSAQQAADNVKDAAGNVQDAAKQAADKAGSALKDAADNIKVGVSLLTLFGSNCLLSCVL